MIEEIPDTLVSRITKSNETDIYVVRSTRRKSPVNQRGQCSDLSGLEALKPGEDGPEVILTRVFEEEAISILVGVPDTNDIVVLVVVDSPVHMS